MTFLALSLAGCVSVPQVQEQINRIDIAADSYIVRAGDTLESVAFRYKLSPAELAGLNPDVGRQLLPGTPLTIRAASNVRDTYRTETAEQIRPQATAGSASVAAAPAAAPAVDQAVTSPVVTQRAVPETRRSGIEAPDNRTVYTPAVTAVVSDVTLLDPSRPYVGQSQPGTAPQEQQTRGWSVQNGAAPETLRQADDGAREQGSSQLAMSGQSTGNTWGGREIIEEEYTGGNALPGQQMSQVVQPTSAPNDGWTWPTQGQVARGFAPIQEGRHGVDIAGVPGQPVVAVNDGVVAYSGRDPSGVGNLIIVKHDHDLLTAYSHTADLFVAENDRVSAGDPIATLGWNAKQESVLRFEVRRNGASVNPMDFLSMR